MVAIVASVGVSCHKLDDDDCALSRTCPDKLFTIYEALGPACTECLRDECSEETKSCSSDLACNLAARCLVAPTPLDYQRCLANLLAADASTSGDRMGAWEGNTKSFGLCLDGVCAERCRRNVPDWSCLGAYDCNDQLPDFKVSVQVYGSGGRFSSISGVTVRACDTVGCEPPMPTDENGALDIDGRRLGSSEGLHFKIEDRADQASEIRFLPTRFYPGCIGETSPQPIALYVVGREIVEAADPQLIADADALTGLARSIVLPESCRPPPPRRLSAPETTIGIKSVSLELCKDGPAPPCLWYGNSDSFPDPQAKDTAAGTTAGILGLTDGSYELQACHGGKVVSRRRVQMEAGGMTIARMWPLTTNEAEAAVDCPTQPSAASAPASPMVDAGTRAVR